MIKDASICAGAFCCWNIKWFHYAWRYNHVHREAVWYLRVRVCACVGGDTGESVNQRSALTGRLRQQLTSQSAAATATTGLRSPSREDSNVHKPSYGGAPPPWDWLLCTLFKININQLTQAWRFALPGLINQSSSPRHCSSEASRAPSVRRTQCPRKRSSLWANTPHPPWCPLMTPPRSIQHGSHNTEAILDL